MTDPRPLQGSTDRAAIAQTRVRRAGEPRAGRVLARSLLGLVGLVGVADLSAQEPTEPPTSRPHATDSRPTAASDAPRDAARVDPIAATLASWPSFRGGSALLGVAPGRIRAPLRLRWRYETEAPIQSSPVIADGIVYVGSEDFAVHAVRLADGTKLWSFATEDIVAAPPLVLDGVVYVGGGDMTVYALDAANGKLLWKQPTGAEIQGSANVVTLADGRFGIVVGSYDATLYCFDARTGERVWTYEAADRINGAPAVVDGLVVFGGCDAVLHVVDGRTGERAPSLALGGDCYVAGSVGVRDGRAYFGHYGNAFVCVDLAASEPVWSYADGNAAFFSSPAITADRVVFGGRDRRIHCVDRATGEQIWAFRTRRKVDGSPVVCGDVVVCGSGDSRLYVLALADGELLQEIDLGRSTVSSPAVAHGCVVIGADDGGLSCFEGAADPERGAAEKPGDGGDD
jgi:outer membrane protein assembly factor BamB